MFRLLFCVILAAFIMGLYGCAGEEKPVNIGPDGDKTPQTTPPPQQTPKEPTEEEIWLSTTCGQCHDQDSMKAMLPKIQEMTTEDVEKALREKCFAALAGKPDAKFTEEDIVKAVDLHKKMKEKMAEKAAEAGEAPAETGTE